MRRFHRKIVKDRKKAHDEYVELKKKMEDGK
jgi:hypothetical protein